MVVRSTRIVRLIAGLAVLVPTAAGCTPEPGTWRDPPTRSTAPAAQVLTQGAQQLKETSFALTLTVELPDGTGTLTGTMDATRRVGTFHTTRTFVDNDAPTVSEWRVLGTVLYTRGLTPSLTPADNFRPWRRLVGDADGGTMATAFDGARMAQALTMASTVNRLDVHYFTGTLEGAAAAQAFGLSSSTTRSDAIQGSAPPPTIVDFTAEIDPAGRLTRYDGLIPTSGLPRKASMTFTRFGVPVDVREPPPDMIIRSAVRPSRITIMPPVLLSAGNP